MKKLPPGMQERKSYRNGLFECSRFRELYEKFRQKTTVAGKSPATMSNYSRHLAEVAIHFNQVRTEVDRDQVKDYFYLVKQRHNTPSDPI